jgi:hypothetical protein
MIFKKIAKIVKGVFKSAQKLLGWLFDIPKPEDPRGAEIPREGSDQQLPVVYGERLLGGVTIHKWVTDSVDVGAGIVIETRKNAYLHMVVAFCHGPVADIGQLLFNGEPESSEQYNNKYRAWKLNGESNQEAEPNAVVNMPNWTAAMRGKNIAYAYIIFYQDKDQTIWRGEPEIKATISGRKLYDPRNGGTGYSQNPALAALDYLTNSIYGRGLNLTDIDLGSFSAAADFCDESTSSTATRTVYNTSEDPDEPPIPQTTTVNVTTKRYQIAAIINTSQTVFNNYRELLQVFRAYPRRPNGLVSLGIEDVAPSEIMTFNESEIIGSIVFKSGGQRDRFNRFTIRYPNRRNNYERDEFTYPQPDNPLYTEWLAEDNDKELIGQLELNTIADTSCAAQSAEIAAKASRISGLLSVALPARARILEPGDIIALNSDLYGWTGKKWRIMDIAENNDNTFAVSLREHDDSVYPWSGAAWDETEGGTWLGNPSQPNAPLNLLISPDPTFATAGTLTWEAVDSAFVRQYDVVVLLGENVVQSNTTRGTSFSIPLLEAGSYQLQVYAVTTLGYRSAPASIVFDLVAPSPPTDIEFTASNFEVEARPVLANAGLGTQFEFAIGGTTPVRGRGVSLVFTGLSHGTEYEVFARTVNALGISAWFSKLVTTTSNGADIVDLIGEDIGAQILPDVIDGVSDDLQQIVDASLGDYSTTTEVNNLINNALDEVAGALEEDPRLTIVEIVNNIFDDYETGVEANNAVLAEQVARETDVFNLAGVIQDESETRALQISTVTVAIDDESAQRTAQVADLNQAIIDESSVRASQFSAVTASIATETSNREAAVVQLNQAIVDEESVRASQFTSLTASIATETSQRQAAVTTLNEAIADESSVRASQITLVQAAIEDEESARVAAITQVNLAIANETSARTTQVNALTASITTETTQRQADITQVNQAIADETSARASAVQQLNATINGVNVATNSRIDSVEGDVSGNATAISALDGSVNNPITGLSASYSLAQLAKTTADGNATSITTINNSINNGTTGLSATFTLATSANNRSLSNSTAIANLTTRVNNAEGDISQAELTLQSTVNELGVVSSRAFLGVTTVTAGRAVINGIVVDGATNTLEFRADTLRLSNTSGAVQLYWDTGRGKWVFNGDLVSANFQTATSGYRAEMGTGTFPFWYGTSTKTLANARFAVDNLGNVTMRNASVQGKIVTSEGTGIRVDVGNDGTYLLWAGTGAKNDVNGIFWIKANGTGFIKGDFFSGQIIESKSGSGTTTATAANHSSDGFPVKVDYSAKNSGTVPGNVEGNIFTIAGSVSRNGAVIGNFEFIGIGVEYDIELNRTRVMVTGSDFIIDTLSTVGLRNYTITLTSYNGALTSSVFIRTDENKLPS